MKPFNEEDTDMQTDEDDLLTDKELEELTNKLAQNEIEDYQAMFQTFTSIATPTITASSQKLAILHKHPWASVSKLISNSK